MEFSPKVLCPHCKAFLEFDNSAGRGLEPECPNRCTLSTEDKPVINIQIMHQYTAYFRLENPIDAS